MEAVALALGAALGWGGSDFLGGVQSRRAALLQVLLVSQLTALLVIAVLVAVRGVDAPGALALALARAAGAGLCEVTAIAALYRGLAVGTMSVVAPVAATAPVVPLLAGLALGEVPGPVEGAGLGLAAAGVVITSCSTAQDAAKRAGPSVLYGLLAALGFGGFFLTMGQAGRADVPWALLAARLTAVTLIVAVAAVERPARPARTTDAAATAAMGLLIVAADAMYATASARGLIGVVAVLGSLHTIVTLALARVFLAERLTRAQQAGVGTALLGVLAISAA